MKKQLAVIIVACGDKFISYLDPLIKSLKKFFPPHDVILFTDSKRHFDAITFSCPHLEWPDASMLRFHMLWDCRQLLSKYSQLLYIDADMLVCRKVEPSDIFSKGITSVLHPDFVRNDYFEKRPESAACVDINTKTPYYQGCIIGGTSKAFLDMSQALIKTIDIDRRNGIIPISYDESHYNRFLIANPPAKILSPYYAWPEGGPPEDQKRVIANYRKYGIKDESPVILHLHKSNQSQWRGTVQTGYFPIDKILIAIYTCKKAAYAERLAAQEATWIPLARKENWQVKIFDGEILGVPDDRIYHPFKTRALCKWALDHGYKKLLKLDDDTYINVLKLSVPYAEYAGWIHPPNPGGMYHEGIFSAPTNCNEFPYVAGPAYWLGERAMKIIANAPINQKTDWAEDRWVGHLLGRSGIKPVLLKNYLNGAYISELPCLDLETLPLAYEILNEAECIFSIEPVHKLYQYHRVFTKGRLLPRPVIVQPKRETPLTVHTPYEVLKQSTDFVLASTISNQNTPHGLKLDCAEILLQRDTYLNQDPAVAALQLELIRNRLKPYIITKLSGGLANQMFQYAVGKAIATENNIRLIIDISSTPHDILGTRYNLDCFSLNDLITTRPRTVTVQETGFFFQPHFIRFKPSMCLNGVWQSEKYFKNIAPLIKKLFTFTMRMDSETNAIAEEIKNSNSVAVHIRRGNYMRTDGMNTHGLVPIQYYENACAIIKRHDPEAKFFIFTDDPKWVGWKKLKGKLVSRDCGPWHLPEHYKDGPRDMYLMTLCKHHIIANSSFSWWGAWLKTRKGLTIAPNEWFADVVLQSQTQDLIPPSWIKLTVNYILAK
jgi:hypothetical protein